MRYEILIRRTICVYTHFASAGYVPVSQSTSPCLAGYMQCGAA